MTATPADPPDRPGSSDAGVPGQVTAPTAEAGGRLRHSLVARRLAVVRAEVLSPTLRRIVLSGPELAGLRALGPTDHVKLFLPTTDGAPVVPPTVRDGVWVDKGDPRLTYREITVRTHVPEAGELVLEIVAGEHGPASRWAARAEPGDEVVVLGPKSSTLRPLDRPQYLAALDETGLPALRNWLDRLPASAQVTALIEVGGPGEQVPLPAAAQLELTWLHRAVGVAAGGPAAPLADAVERLVAERPVEARAAWWWAAAEASQVRRIRAAAATAGVAREDTSMTAYWRRGEAHFDHKSPAA